MAAFSVLNRDFFSFYLLIDFVHLSFFKLFNVYFVRVENILKKAVVVWKESMLSFDLRISFSFLLLFLCCFLLFTLFKFKRF